MDNFQRRKQTRLEDHNYTEPGFYFLTLCAFEKRKIFSEVIGKNIRMSQPGKILEQCWTELPRFVRNVSLDAHVIMPNHVHGIIRLNEENETPLGQVIRNFKSVSTRKIRQTSQKTCDVWQKNYYERVIRNERELNLIRLYIKLNPLMWEENKTMKDIVFRSEEELVELLEPYRDHNL